MAYNNPSFKSASSFGSAQLAVCLARVAEQRQLLVRVRSALPAEIAQHVEHSLISGNKLIVYTQTAAWASQIRFFQQVLLNKLQVSGQGNLGVLQVKLLRRESLPTTRPPKTLPAAEVVQSLINDGIDKPEDELSAALHRLGNTLKKRLTQ